MRLVLLGPPGSGKGTLSGTLTKEFQTVHISTGDIFREHQQNHTEFGRQISYYIDRGHFVPDKIVLNIIGEYLFNRVGKKGFILDGFPRDIAQAEAFESLLSEMGISLDAVVSLDIPVEVAVQRLVQRRVCPQCKSVYHLTNRPPKKSGICDLDGCELVHRHDDHEDVIAARIEEYRNKTAPLTNFYKERNLLRSFDGSGAPEHISSIVVSELKKLIAPAQ